MKTIKCEFCETHLREDEVINFEGISMCPSCLNERTRIYEWCAMRGYGLMIITATTIYSFADTAMMNTILIVKNAAG